MSEPIRLGDIIPGAMEELLKRKTEAERIQIEERAAIIEYDGGLTREEAERKAVEGEVENEK